MASEEDRQSWASAAGAVIPLVVFGGVLAWWGWKSGGYFEVTFLPGTMILLGIAAAFLLYAPAVGALRGAALVSLAGLVGLAAWTLISGLWSPVPAVAFSDSQRALGYAAAFVIGAWSCLLAPPANGACPRPACDCRGPGGVRDADRSLGWVEFHAISSKRTRPSVIRSAIEMPRRPSS